ncbi:hypothetical protein MIMGU_mgv1a024011mg [Erythranthe guttata]|uniref:C2H2-type domain-containing protein n=2 Tax=Erythranthe guttata TaxID=4155 RepID=A0A022QLL5_ERYGU|nr:hypothetical protein MIMGU_mgv1a024011mg [Erythranthe guttata]
MNKDMMESRFVCKFCNKKYPCGKSLGGHMRSHVVAISAESDDKFEVTMKESKNGESGNGGVSSSSAYGLRENPKKTWRAVDSRAPLPQDKVCKQCGKGFQSMKALCGHMACHSDKERGVFKDDNCSWTSESRKIVVDGHSDTEEAEEVRTTRSSLSKSSARYKKLVDNSSFNLGNNNGSSSVTEIDGVDQEEVAMCLMMLSKDSGCNKGGGGGGVNSVVESSDNNSVVLETKSSSIEMIIGRKESVSYGHNQNEASQIKKLNATSFGEEIEKTENSDSGYFLDECAKAESDVSVDGFRRYGGFGEFKKSSKLIKNEYADGDDYDDDNGVMASNLVARTDQSRKRKYGSENPEPRNGSPKKSKYECFNCKKVFKSYQALGGHRPCHKRVNEFQESRYESVRNSQEDSTNYKKLVEPSSSKKPSAKKLATSHNAEKKNKAKKSKGHVCPFCDRVFKNGQALGGHKRSHFIGGHDENYINRSPVEKKTEQQSDLLDLNLPAPEADEDYERGQFFSW